MKKSVAIAFSGVMTALLVVLLLTGSVIWILAYTMPLICGLIMLVVKESVGRKYAWIVYAAASIISTLILTGDEGIMLFVLFFGYYPIIKDGIDKLKHKALRILLKLLVFNAGVVLCEVIVTFVFGVPFDLVFGRFTVAFLLITGNIIFLAYEKMLLVVRVLYYKKLKKRLDKYLK